MDKVPFSIPHCGRFIQGWFCGLDRETPPRHYHIAIEGHFVGTLVNEDGTWYMGGIWGVELAGIIGNYIELWWQ